MGAQNDKDQPHLNTNLMKIFDPNIPNMKDWLKLYLAYCEVLEYFYTDNSWYTEKVKKDYEGLDQKWKDKMEGVFDYKAYYEKIDNAIKTNNICIQKIKEIFYPEKKYFDLFKKEEIDDLAYKKENEITFELFYYIARDWTDNKDGDRRRQYDVIIEEVNKYLKKQPAKILVPGAGLCRLAYDLSLLGYDIDCNDLSFLNYMFSDFILTRAKKKEFKIIPKYIDRTNYFREADIFEEYEFPNIETGLNKEGQGKMYYNLGDFTLMYNDIKDYYDSVITVYFLDSALNAIQYIEIISRVLKKGGVWINYGPPTYDWGRHNKLLFPLPWDKMKEVIANYGLEIVKEEHVLNAYCYEYDKMCNTKNYCVIFTAVKK